MIHLVGFIRLLDEGPNTAYVRFKGARVEYMAKLTFVQDYKHRLCH